MGRLWIDEAELCLLEPILWVACVETGGVPRLWAISASSSDGLLAPDLLSPELRMVGVPFSLPLLLALGLVDGSTGGVPGIDPWRETVDGVPCLRVVSARSSDWLPGVDVL